MAIHLTAYAAPLVGGGVAYVATGPVLGSLRGAGTALAALPLATELVLCVADPPGAHWLDEGAARTLFRRAAVAATTGPESAATPAVGRVSAGVRRTVVGFGWLLLLTGGTIATGLAGLWVALGFPQMRQRTLERADPSRAAAALARVVESAPIAARSHAGLGALAQLVASTTGADSAAARYRRAAAACAALGVAPLADFYAALARGVTPALVWAEVTPSLAPRHEVPEAATASPAEEEVSEPLHEPA
jgi:hypothetical protein